MGFRVYFGKTEKKLNSTYRPDWESWDWAECVWKHPKDIDAPTVEIARPGRTDYPQFNMMYIPEVSSFYWITSIVSVRAGVWQISGEMDVLATWRDQIMDTNCYILYGHNEDRADGPAARIIDDRLNVMNVPGVASTTWDVFNGTVSNTGFYVLSAVGAKGGVVTYGVLLSEMQNLLQTMGQDVTDAIEDVAGTEEILGVLKYFTKNNVIQGSAISAIRSCIWLPLSHGLLGTFNMQEIYLGDFETGCFGTVLGDNPIRSFLSTHTIPWPYDDWRRMLSQVSLYIPYVGTISIPTEQCNSCSTINVNMSVEFIGGGCAVEVLLDNKYVLYSGTAQIGTNYSIGTSNVPITNAVAGTAAQIGGTIEVGKGTVSGLVSAATAWAPGVADAAQQITSGVNQAMQGYAQTITPLVQCTGSMSGAAAMGLSGEARATVFFRSPIGIELFQEEYGWPVMHMDKPVLGYCQTKGFSMRSEARAAEMAQISRMMDGGVFIE